jgi:hypothetical protein
MTPRPSHDVPSQRDPELPPGAPHCPLIGLIYVAGALETVESSGLADRRRDGAQRLRLASRHRTDHRTGRMGLGALDEQNLAVVEALVPLADRLGCRRR